MKPRLIIAGLALTTVLALMGWTRKPAVDPANFNGPAETMPAAAEPAPASPAPAPEAAVPSNRPATGHRDRMVAQRTEPVRMVEPNHVEPTHRVVVHRRPLSHSVAIVGASAGTGAAIGALAGGGKGAGIGALVAGAGGFIYDRLTHEKKTVQ